LGKEMIALSSPPRRDALHDFSPLTYRIYPMGCRLAMAYL
jgi:hypothetical protein